MATRSRPVKIDENDANKSKKATNSLKVGATAQTKRPALGELGNRAVAKSTEPRKEDAPYIKYNEGLRNAKPRVDTHWKKTEVNATTVNKVIEAKLRKPVATTAATKPISVVKPFKAGPVKVEEKASLGSQSGQQQLVTIRREESTVSRKPLSKLKAVLCKDNKDKSSTATTSSLSRPFAATALQPKPFAPTALLPKPIASAALLPKPFEVQCKTAAHSSALLDEIENIDAGDSENPLLVSEYANDIYAHLFDMEIRLPIRKKHLDKQTEVSPKMRAVLFDWINEVHYQFRLLPETYHLTIAIIDRYLQVIPTTMRKHLQLVGIGALFLASKYEELYPPEIGDFVYIADDTYTKKQILAIEQRIIKNVDYNLGRPSSIHFLRRFSKAANNINEIHMLAKYLIELVTIEYSLAHYKPSEVAAASLFLSIKLLNVDQKLTDHELWTNTLQFYSTYTVEDLRPLVKQIALLVKNAPNAPLKAVYTKYTSSKFDKISTKAELSGPLLAKICSDE